MEWDIATLVLVAWLQLYTHAANHRSDPFWEGFLNPFGV